MALYYIVLFFFFIFLRGVMVDYVLAMFHIRKINKNTNEITDDYGFRRRINVNERNKQKNLQAYFSIM